MYSAGGYLQQPSSKVISKQFLDRDKESLLSVQSEKIINLQNIEDD